MLEDFSRMRNYPLSSRCAETTPTMVMSKQKLLTQSLLKFTPHQDMLEVWIAIFLLNGDKLCPFYFWSIIMNELADIFGAESEEALLLGQLDAAAVFMEEDFDPTPATEEYA